MNKGFANTALRLIAGGAKFLFHIALTSKIGLAEYGKFINVFAIVNILILILGLELYTIVSHKIANKEWTLNDGLKHEMYYIIVIVIPLILILHFGVFDYSIFIWAWILSEIFLRNCTRYLVAHDSQIESSAINVFQAICVLIFTLLLLDIFSIWIILVLSNINTLLIVLWIYKSKSNKSLIPLNFYNFVDVKTIIASGKMLIVGVGNRILHYADRIFLIDLINPVLFGQIAFLGSMISSLGMIIDPLIYQIRLPHYIKGNTSTIFKDFYKISVIVVLGTFCALLIFSLKYHYEGSYLILIGIVIIYSLIFLNNFLQFILYTQKKFDGLFKSILPLTIMILLGLFSLELPLVFLTLLLCLTSTIFIKYVYIKKIKAIL